MVNHSSNRIIAKSAVRTLRIVAIAVAALALQDYRGKLGVQIAPVLDPQDKSGRQSLLHTPNQHRRCGRRRRHEDRQADVEDRGDLSPLLLGTLRHLLDEQTVGLLALVA